MSTPRPVSRREFFSRFLRMGWEAEDRNSMEVPAAASESHVAVIQGRHCLAYQNSFCSVCVERCPVPGALLSERGLPRVVTDHCTGCGECHDCCPSPVNAILMVPAK